MSDTYNEILEAGVVLLYVALSCEAGWMFCQTQ